MFKKYKNKIIISSLVIIGIALIIIGSMNGNKKKDADFNSTLYTNAMEEKIEDFLESIAGIKKAKVIVTLDTSEEKVYAQNGNSLDYILTNDGSPISITEIYPTVRGVAIACTNGNNMETKIQITELITAYLGISSNRVQIVQID